MEIRTPVERTLTRTDHVRLTRLLQQQPAFARSGAMQQLLEASDLVASPAVPPDVLTMYTQVQLQDEAGDVAPYQLTLCYPEHAEPAQGFVSVLSPVGTALIGRRAGETARWPLPGGRSGAARIVSVLFQPEASGDYAT